MILILPIVLNNSSIVLELRSEPDDSYKLYSYKIKSVYRWLLRGLFPYLSSIIPLGNIQILLQYNLNLSGHAQILCWLISVAIVIVKSWTNKIILFMLMSCWRQQKCYHRNGNVYIGDPVGRKFPSVDYEI